MPSSRIILARCAPTVFSLRERSGTGELHKGHGIAFADLGNNGNEDIIAEVGGATYGDRHALRVFKNPGNGNDWINLKLVGAKTNRGAVGARIKVTVENMGQGTRSICRTVGSGGSFGASPLQQHIGLGKDAHIAELEIWWPTSNTRQHFSNVDKDQFLEIKEFAQEYTKLDRRPYRLGGPQRNAPVLAQPGTSSCWAHQQYPVTGMVLKADPSRKTFIVSCQSIPGYMDAMVMPFEVREARDLEGLKPGMTVEFTLVAEKESNYAEHVQIRSYESGEQDPLTARRLKLLNQLSHPAPASALKIGESAPNFTLTDQNRLRTALSQFVGKVVAINFIYTSCALPNFCFRNSNNFGVLQKRFQARMGRELVLLTVTFDPQRDDPDVLEKYARNWKADPATWHFLTGSVPDIQHVSNLFGVDYFPDEGLMDHSLHTAIIDREGRLAANLEGNQFTAEQLGDLVQTVMNRRSSAAASTHLAHNQDFESSTRR